MLARLQLSGIRDQLDNLLGEAARANLAARETLILLCEREIARKDHRPDRDGAETRTLPCREGAGGLRLRGAALDRSKADPRPGRVSLDRPRDDVLRIPPLRAALFDGRARCRS